MRMSNTKGKIVRRYGENIFGNPKFDRLLKRKAEIRRDNRRRPRRMSEFGRQLREKQKLKFIYGLTEKQFRNLFDRAKRMDGVTGHNFLSLLERRLDNVVFQAGMASSRKQARQFVNHGHFLLNGRRVDVPSIATKDSDHIAVRNKKTTAEMIRKQLSHNSNYPVPAWILITPDTLSAKIIALPTAEQINVNIEEQLVVEYYSR